ncbi:hypothetical protein BEWA_027880 [Theileria equi strain WA]|uniref:Uncharacterized protein n=1 Tax=Theileria equi strain WA TaxID=1537102 RepID=L0AYI5_THEEQ|nr:hypothetical protein BEWA_027880 [Theileria equi strain WA]AFZ79939.1 hypothetical protein BEWA_027880 [Theileria equi strain WA]|eukprot:XP_004829605.1 hypothetical protein BEWA_027880 [Theileria equi strain WA]
MSYISLKQTHINLKFHKERQLIGLLTQKAQKNLKLGHYDRAKAFSSRSLWILKSRTFRNWDIARARNILAYAGALLKSEPINAPKTFSNDSFDALPDRRLVESEWIRFVSRVITCKDRIKIVSRPLGGPYLNLLQLDRTIESLICRYSACSINLLPKLLTIRALLTEDEEERCGFSIMALLMDVNAEFGTKVIDIAIRSLYNLGHENYKVLTIAKGLLDS